MQLTKQKARIANTKECFILHDHSLWSLESFKYKKIAFDKKSATFVTGRLLMHILIRM